MKLPVTGDQFPVSSMTGFLTYNSSLETGNRKLETDKR